ncbi:MAG: hypothetical protein MJ006_04620 [Methanocorpusculum sp.]|nr:hypothetical protein [Methanocorpusculum sp.]
MSPVLLGVVVLFAAVCAFSFGSTHNMAYVFFGVPLVILLIVMPLVLVYTSEKQILKNLPQERAAARFVKARHITPAMRGTVVIIEGKITRVSGIYMNKPVYVIEDSTGSIVAKRVALPERLVGVGANVEVLGRVFAKNNGTFWINAETITPIAKFRETVPAGEEQKPEPEKIHIKHYN